MLSGARPRVLGLHWSDVCAPWRVTTPLRALGEAGYEVRDGSMAEQWDVADIDLLVLHRPMTEANLELIQRARRAGVVVVVDVDDLFMPDALPPTGFCRTWDPLYFRWEAEERAIAGIDSPAAIAAAPRNNRQELFQEALRAADTVTVTTAELAAAYQGFGTPVHILPNCYDDAQALWTWTPPPRATVNIGFTSSDFQADNLNLLGGAIEPILRAHPHVRLVEAGGPELLPRVDVPAAQLVHLGTLPFATFPLLLHQMDIVLAPLADTPFMRAKSNIRCLTAGLVGAPVVASPAGAYAEYVTHGTNGFLARSPGDWTRHLEQLVVDESLRRRLGEANRRRAQTYAISTNLWRWVEVYESLLNRPGRA